MTEVGRQPWIVYNVMRTSNAVSTRGGIWITFGLIVALYVGARRDPDHPLTAMSRRWRRDEDGHGRRAVQPRIGPAAPSSRGGVDDEQADVVAGVPLVGATMYAIFGGADFGAGVWSLLAGGGDRGRRPRELIDWAIGPVWEANHVWLIFVLVVLWTGFPTAFECDLLHALHPPQPRGARDRAARGRVCLPAHRTAGARACDVRVLLRVRLTPHAVLHGHRGGRDRRRARAGGKRERATW